MPRLLPISTTLRNMLIELIVVFIGLSAAFLLNDYRDNRKQEEREQRILATLYAELVPLDTLMAHLAPSMERFRDNFLKAYRNGEKPILPTLYYVQPQYKVDLLEATLQSTNLVISDPKLLFNLTNLYTAVRLTAACEQKLTDLTEEHILPVHDQGVEVFYEPGTTKLKSRFRWFLTYIECRQYSLKAIQQQVSEITADLSQRLISQ